MYQRLKKIKRMKTKLKKKIKIIDLNDEIERKIKFDKRLRIKIRIRNNES